MATLDELREASQLAKQLADFVLKFRFTGYNDLHFRDMYDSIEGICNTLDNALRLKERESLDAWRLQAPIVDKYQRGGR